MKIKRKLYSNKEDRDELIGGGSLIAGTGVLSKTKPSRLTGKVVRYHDAPTEVIEKIKKEGLKTKYAEDPNNLTNTALKDVDMDKKRGKVYTSKSKRFAFGVGERRAQFQGKEDFSDIVSPFKRSSKHHKVLKLELDYDEDIKGKPKIENPELRGTKNAKEFYNKIKDPFSPDYDSLDPISKKLMDTQYDQLSSKGTHIFDKDIDSSKIVGGKGYKKRTLKQIGKYIKNNPKRFGKEAAKVSTGIALVGYGAKKLYDSKKKEKL